MRADTHGSNWDEIWSEFDAREGARIKATTPSATPIAPTLAPKPQHLEAATETVVARWGFGRLMRVAAVMVCTAVAFYAGSPVASAVQFAAAIQRGDATTLAHHIDWPSLRPALDAALAAEVQRNDSEPMPGFIAGMAQDIAQRLAPPEGFATPPRLAASAMPPAREMLSRVRMLEAGLWQVTLPMPNMGDRPARLTLALTDVARLRWEVQAIELPTQLPARFR